MLDDIIPEGPSFSEYGVPVCSEVDPELFFPQENFDHTGKLISSSYISESYAKSLCTKCPYRMACFSYAMENYELIGIWGATTDGERRNARRRISRRDNIRTKLQELDVK